MKQWRNDTKPAWWKKKSNASVHTLQKIDIECSRCRKRIWWEQGKSTKTNKDKNCSRRRKRICWEQGKSTKTNQDKKCSSCGKKIWWEQGIKYQNWQSKSNATSWKKISQCWQKASNADTHALIQIILTYRHHNKVGGLRGGGGGAYIGVHTKGSTRSTDIQNKTLQVFHICFSYVTKVYFYSLSFCLFHDQKHIHSLSFCLYYDQRFILLFLSLLWSEVYSTLCLSIFIVIRGLFHSLSFWLYNKQRFIPHIVSPFLWSEAYSSLHHAVASCVYCGQNIFCSTLSIKLCHTAIVSLHTSELSHTALVSLHTQLSSVIQH